MQDTIIDDLDDRCELCGDDFMVTTVCVSVDPTEDNCVRETASICVGCLFVYEDNSKLMVDVLERRIDIKKVEEEGEDELGI